MSHDGAEYQGIAARFVAARRDVRGLADYPGAIPQTLDNGYAIQDRAIGLTNLPIGGWKVGRIMPPLSERYGSDRLAGPIFVPTILAVDAASRTDGKPVSMPIFAEGFGAAEAEFLLRIGAAPDPQKTRFTLDEAAALIDAVHVGIEIASSPLGAINDLGPAVTVSDFGNNNGLVIGAPIPDWRESGFDSWPVALLIDGVEAGRGRGDAMPDGPIGAARFLFELMARRGIALMPGQWISSGAVTGVHPVTPGARVEARFGDDYTVSCTIEAATTNMVTDAEGRVGDDLDRG